MVQTPRSPHPHGKHLAGLEHLRLEPALGISTWWLNHADPHMRILMDKEGPFNKCAYDGHKPPAPEKAALSHVVPAAGIFD
ncbi:hypothetical protein QFZ79_001702 [Arthrobacter sp. V4I6]|nr:hypothetical protein [Arthrobacter sp. V1I7]MDQ0853591.1 hypothetical protein [Arthrobacter sp. V4I6]